MLCVVVVVLLALKVVLADRLATPWVGAFSVVFAAVCIQATPFVVLGVVVSTVLRVVVPAGALARALPQRHSCSVPVVGLAGLLLPGCECGSVPVASSLMASGVPPASAIAFLLSAPAVNPIVLVATAVAFPGHPQMVLARFLASFTAAVAVGWLWPKIGCEVSPRRAGHRHFTRGSTSAATVAQDLCEALGLLVVGAALTSLIKLELPQSWLDAARGHAAAGVLVLAALAVVLAVCSEADAFIAASFSQFSPTAQLAFMVVGPMVDLKLAAMQIGTFGRRFAARLMPLTFTAAVAAAAMTGAVLL